METPSRRFKCMDLPPISPSPTGPVASANEPDLVPALPRPPADLPLWGHVRPLRRTRPDVGPRQATLAALAAATSRADLRSVVLNLNAPSGPVSIRVPPPSTAPELLRNVLRQRPVRSVHERRCSNGWLKFGYRTAIRSQGASPEHFVVGLVLDRDRNLRRAWVAASDQPRRLLADWMSADEDYGLTAYPAAPVAECLAGSPLLALPDELLLNILICVGAPHDVAVTHPRLTPLAAELIRRPRLDLHFDALAAAALQSTRSYHQVLTNLARNARLGDMLAAAGRHVTPDGQTEDRLAPQERARLLKRLERAFLDNVARYPLPPQAAPPMPAPQRADLQRFVLGVCARRQLLLSTNDVLPPEVRADLRGIESGSAFRDLATAIQFGVPVPVAVETWNRRPGPGRTNADPNDPALQRLSLIAVSQLFKSGHLLASATLTQGLTDPALLDELRRDCLHKRLLSLAYPLLHLDPRARLQEMRRALQEAGLPHDQLIPLGPDPARTTLAGLQDPLTRFFTQRVHDAAINIRERGWSLENFRASLNQDELAILERFVVTTMAKGLLDETGNAEEVIARLGILEISMFEAIRNLAKGVPTWIEHPVREFE